MSAVKPKSESEMNDPRSDSSRFVSRIRDAEPVGSTVRFRYNDGGRTALGLRKNAGDCVCRAITIASQRPYDEVYERLAKGNAEQRITKHSGRHKRSAGVETADYGIWTTRQWFKNYMEELSFIWVPTMRVGQGCKVHLRAEELPKGRLIVAVSRHYTTMIDGVIHDTFDPSRGGSRCVYGFWISRD